MPKVINWLLVSPTVLILFYNAYVKLSGNPGAVQLFSGLQLEPFGRILAGTLETIAAILLLYPPTLKYGAIMATTLMVGVILVHLTKIGIALGGDYSFFVMGVVAFCCSGVLTWISYKGN